MNFVFLFNKYQKIFIWLLASARKISFCPKNNRFARLRGGGLPFYCLFHALDINSASDKFLHFLSVFPTVQKPNWIRQRWRHAQSIPVWIQSPDTRDSAAGITTTSSDCLTDEITRMRFQWVFVQGTKRHMCKTSTASSLYTLRVYSKDDREQFRTLWRRSCAVRRFGNRGSIFFIFIHQTNGMQRKKKT